MLDLRLRDAHPVHPPVSDLVLVLLKLSFGILINAHEECAPSHARERRWPVGFEIKVNSRSPVMRVVLWYVKRMAEYRINVIGASGSGTSTLGRSLALALNIPFFDSDDYFHAPTDPPFQKQRPDEERFEMICRDLRPERSWVLSGGIVGWLPCPTLNFTCIVFLYVPTAVRVERLIHRERMRFGDRINEGGDMHETHKKFIDWTSRYDTGGIEGKTLEQHEGYLRNQLCPVLEFRDVGSVSDITASVLQFIGERASYPF